MPQPKLGPLQCVAPRRVALRCGEQSAHQKAERLCGELGCPSRSWGRCGAVRCGARRGEEMQRGAQRRGSRQCVTTRDEAVDLLKVATPTPFCLQWSRDPDLTMHPIPVRLTPKQADWIRLQASCGSLSRSAAIRLCIQHAMESPAPLLSRTADPERSQAQL